MAINKRKILQSAQKHLQKGALDKALKDYQALLKADPKDANIRLKIGDIFLKQGNSEEAVGAYLKVATRFMDDGFDAKAVALFKQIVRIDPKRLEVYPPLAELYQRLGLNSDAMSALQTAADAHYRDGDRDQALDLLRRMAGLDPTNTANRMKVADLLRQENRTDEAVEEFRAVATELERQGDVEGRVVALERIVELAPDDRSVLLELGGARLELGALLEAEEVARRLVEADADVAEHHELMAQTLEKAEKLDAAAVHWRRVAELCRARGDESRARDLMQRYGEGETLGPEESAEPVLDQTDELAFGEVGSGELGLESDEFSDPGFVSQDGMQLGVPMGAAGDSGAGEEPEITAGDFSLEPVADAGGLGEAEAAPAAASPGTARSLDGDPDQMVAEASVLLRYGKHDRAIETLRSVVEAVPDHRGALSKLADALEASGDGAGAGKAREQLAALDAAPTAAPEPAAPAPEPAASSAPAAEIDLDDEVDLELESPAPESASDDAPEMDLDIDLEAAEPGLDLSGGDGFDLTGDPGAAPDLEAADPGLADAGVTRQLDPLDLDADDDSGVDLEIDLSGDDAGEPAPVRDLDAEEDLGLLDTPAGDAAAASAGVDLEASADELDFDLDDELPQSGASAADPLGDDLDLDLELDPASTTSAEPADAAAAAGASEVGDDVAPEVSAPAADAAAAAEIDLSEDLEVAAPAPQTADSAEGSPAGVEGSSATTPRQMVDDLEEAEFYFQQGMMSEAREAYGRILAVSPNHPQALLRLGEIDASSSSEDQAPAVEAAAPDAEEAAAAGALDDLDDDRPRVDDTQVADMHLAEGADDALFEAGFGDEPLEGEDEAAAEEPFDLEITADLGEGASDDALADAVSAQAKAAEDDTVTGAAALASEADPGTAPEADPGGAPVAAATSGEEEERDPLGDSFDLAAELSESLEDEAPAGAATSGSSTEEEGFEQVFAAFKQGVQKELGEGDHEAHYDLGIAYKEMGLLDDAILEFGQAMGNPERKLACLHMMGLCALDLGRVADATAHLEQALALPELPAEQQLGLRYDLGRAYAESGDRERARACFEAVLELEPGFGDVEERLAALDDPGGAAASDDDADEEAEAFESFDDLIGESDAEPLDPEAAAEPEYESFDDLMGDDGDSEAVEADAEPVAALEPAEDGDDGLEVVADPTAPPVDGLDAEAQAEPDEAELLDAEPLDEAGAAPDESPDPGTGGKPRRRKKISFV